MTPPPRIGLGGIPIPGTHQSESEVTPPADHLRETLRREEEHRRSLASRVDLLDQIATNTVARVDDIDRRVDAVGTQLTELHTEWREDAKRRAQDDAQKAAAVDRRHKVLVASIGVVGAVLVAVVTTIGTVLTARVTATGREQAAEVARQTVQTAAPSQEDRDARLRALVTEAAREAVRLRDEQVDRIVLRK